MPVVSQAGKTEFRRRPRNLQRQMHQTAACPHRRKARRIGDDHAMLISRPFLCIAAVLALLLAGCAGTPPASKPSDERDGVSAQVPPNLAQLPDVEPRIEAVRSGGPNRPYEALGKRYTPMTGDAPFRERGLASWYGRKFHGRPTASGETYDMHAMTAAHPTLPIPSYARVRNPANGREVVVRINDRGPFHAGRIVDLSYTAALKLDLLRGVGQVELQRITFEDIRTGAWKRGDAPATEAVTAAAPVPAETAAVMSATAAPPVVAVVAPAPA